MSEQQGKDKLVVIATCGPDDHERSSLAFTMANAALAMDAVVKVILQADGVMLARKGTARHVRAPFMTPLAELLQSFFEQGGQIYACTPCCKARDLTKDDLLEGTELVTAGFVVDEAMSAKTVFTY